MWIGVDSLKRLPMKLQISLAITLQPAFTKRYGAFNRFFIYARAEDPAVEVVFFWFTDIN